MPAPITAVEATSSRYTSAPVSAPKQKLDGEVFLNLLVTQLRNQDPSSPMDTNEMLAQTTQLASMEQLTALAGLTEESFSLQMRGVAATLLGSEVDYTGDDGEVVTGVVTAVSYRDSVPTVTVGDTQIRLDGLLGVRAASD
ncbi:MAG: flagellar hook capping FlgD N-terminal domain-containing protein [Microbacteriaceae bacterium]